MIDRGANVTEPREICGHTFIRWLKPDATALCRTGSGRAIVVKRLDRDCLLEGTLHPEIRERLARVRELAHGHVSTLVAVERDAEGAVYTTWEFVEGTPLVTWLCDPMRDERAAARMLRELVLAVEALHDQGIIHGALHEGNIIVNGDSRVSLLGISPLLFDDTREDIAAIRTLIADVVAQRAEQATPIGRALLQQVKGEQDLRSISATISRALQERDESPAAAGPSDDEIRVRREARRWALICAAIAAVIGLLLWWSATRDSVAPPQAPPEALESRN